MQWPGTCYEQTGTTRTRCVGLRATYSKIVTEARCSSGHRPCRALQLGCLWSHAARWSLTPLVAPGYRHKRRAWAILFNARLRVGAAGPSTRFGLVLPASRVPFAAASSVRRVIEVDGWRERASQRRDHGKSARGCEGGCSGKHGKNDRLGRRTGVPATWGPCDRIHR